MKKILIGLVGLVAVIALVVTVFLGKLDGLILDAIETEGTAALGSKVSVASVETDIAEGFATITGLTVANPPGYQAANAISMPSFSATVDYDTQIVKEIVIDEPVINAELKGQKNNFEDLLANMPEDEELQAGEEEEELELIIERFVLRQAKVNLIADKLGQREFVLGDFVLNNLSGTVDEISEQMTSKLTAHLAEEVKSYARKEIAILIKQEASRRIKEEVNKKLTDKLGGKLKGLKLGIN